MPEGREEVLHTLHLHNVTHYMDIAINPETQEKPLHISSISSLIKIILTPSSRPVEPLMRLSLHGLRANKRNGEPHILRFAAT
jgi:hypothetical protein